LTEPAVPTGVPLLLLEGRTSPHSARIERAAREAGLAVQYLDALEGAPPDAALIGVGPSVGDPLDVARHLRRSGSQALLVFFTASSSERASLQAELVRDPFLYSRFELIEIPDNPRQLASCMGRVVANVERQAHLASGPGVRRRPKRGAATRPQSALAGEQYLANLLAQVNESIFSTDDTLQFLTWNRAAEGLFGFEAQSVLGRSIALLDAPGASGDRLEALAGRVLDTGLAAQAQLKCATAGGGSVQVALSLAPVKDQNGTIIGLSVIARDDSQYQRLEEALRHANRQKDEFLAIMSHELRTPLTSILGYTDMLLRGLSGPLAPLTNKYIGNVRSAGDRLLQLVNGLLDYTRLEAGADRLDLRPVDLTGLVTSSVEAFQRQAHTSSVDLRLTLGKRISRVDADYETLSHVLRNFLGNALKFTPKGGWVAVHVGPDPESPTNVRVSVSDSGIGMRHEQVPRVWERFYQGDASLTRPYGGMGLGLSIARHLVTLQGGTVGAESGGPGLGSTFWFTLPIGRTS
jgi:PAS domain S-box-containing protein